jgi:hypothetical protein
MLWLKFAHRRLSGKYDHNPDKALDEEWVLVANFACSCPSNF